MEYRDSLKIYNLDLLRRHGESMSFRTIRQEVFLLNRAQEAPSCLYEACYLVVLHLLGKLLEALSEKEDLARN